MLRYKPRITKEVAGRQLVRRSNFLPFRKISPSRVELVEMPYYFFELEVSTRKSGTKNFHAALDGILGTFAMVDAGALDSEEADDDFEFCFELDRDEAKDRVFDESRWELYRRAMKDRERYSIEKVSEARECYYPFWVGYFEKKKKWDFTALDAVTGVLQGGPMRRVFVKAFCDKRNRD